ncbi:hypothetical protein [Hymenobacter terrenus]|nr:hypothetical protein [Hymenobacter terrenus]
MKYFLRFRRFVLPMLLLGGLTLTSCDCDDDDDDPKPSNQSDSSATK